MSFKKHYKRENSGDVMARSTVAIGAYLACALLCLALPSNAGTHGDGA